MKVGNMHEQWFVFPHFARPQKDPYYDFAVEEKEQKKEEEKKKQQARQSKCMKCC